MTAEHVTAQWDQNCCPTPHIMCFSIQEYRNIQQPWFKQLIFTSSKSEFLEQVGEFWACSDRVLLLVPLNKNLSSDIKTN